MPCKGTDYGEFRLKFTAINGFFGKQDEIGSRRSNLTSELHERKLGDYP